MFSFSNCLVVSGNSCLSFLSVHRVCNHQRCLSWPYLSEEDAKPTLSCTVVTYCCQFMNQPKL